MKRPGFMLAALTVLLVAGCTPDGPQPAVTPSAPQTFVAPDSPAPSSAQATTTPSQVDPDGVCSAGRYVLTRFYATGPGSSRLTGTGNDLTATFTDGTYLMRAAGRSPYVLVSDSGRQAKLTMKGTMRGTYAGAGDEISFTVVGGQGTAKLEAGGETRTSSMTQLTKTLAPTGRVATTCSGDQMTITMKSIILELEQV